MITGILRAEIKQAIREILEDFGATTEEEFMALEPDSGIYEDLKAGVLEEFALDDDDMGELLDEVLAENASGLALYLDEIWDEYIFGSDDSMTFVEYLSEKGKEELSLKEIFEDIGLDKLQWNFKESDSLSACVEGLEVDIQYAIDIILNLAALLLECKVNGNVKLNALWCDEFDPEESVCITATQEEHQLMNQALKDFVAEPLSYDMSEMLEEDELQELAEICEELRKALYGDE